MTDVHSKAVRSYNMSQIKGKNTKPELIVRSFLHQNGFRFRLHCKDLPGKPDIVLKKYKTVVLVHGCFWHGHKGCKYFVVPKTRQQWWLDKINRNKVKDAESYKELIDQNWKIITIWECELKKGKIEITLVKLLNQLSGQAFTFSLTSSTTGASPYLRIASTIWAATALTTGTATEFPNCL